MAENLDDLELEAVQTLQAKPRVWTWLLQIWYNPRGTFQQILHLEKGIWWVPLVILSVLQILKNIIESPIKSAAALAAQQEALAQQAAGAMDMGGKGVTADPQTMSTFTSGPVFTILLPAAIAVLGIWVIWVIYGSMLHLSLTLAGNRNNATTSLNLMSWATLPLGLRLIVQIIAILATQKLIVSPGLSGFFASSTGQTGGFFASLMANVDLFVIWQLVLLVVGALVMGNISRGKAIISVLVCLVVILCLQALPGVISSAFSGMSGTTIPFF